MDETRNQRFRRLATKRAEKVADDLRKIGNLGSSNYEYSQEEIDRLFSYIEERMQEARSRFRTPSDRRVPSLEF